MRTWSNKLLLLPDPLQPTRLHWRIICSSDHLQSKGFHRVVPPKISLWTQLHWAVLGLRKTNLPSQSRILVRRCPTEKCTWCTWSSSVIIHATVCKSVLPFCECIQPWSQWETSCVGSKKVSGTSYPPRQHHGWNREGTRRLSAPSYCLFVLVSMLLSLMPEVSWLHTFLSYNFVNTWLIVTEFGNSWDIVYNYDF